MESLPERLESLGIKKSSPEVFDAVLELVTTLRVRGMSEDDLRLTLELVSSGYDEIQGYPIYDEDSWMDFDYGNVKPGDYVKVRGGIYETPTGMKHNNRVGRITNISGRRVNVRYLGTSRVSDMTHPIANLQTLKYGLQWKTK